MNWIPFNLPAQIQHITESSHQTPCLIFKHSTRCSISSIAKFRLENSWVFSDTEIKPFFLDLIAERSISDAVAEHFQVHHESPQIILIWKGEVILDASHLDISVDELQEVLAFEN